MLISDSRKRERFKGGNVVSLEAGLDPAQCSALSAFATSRMVCGDS